MKEVAVEMQGIIDRRWNSERFIIFQSVILQRLGEVKKANDLRRQIEVRMKAWKAGKYNMLVQDTVRTSIALLSEIKKGIMEE